MNPEIKNLIGFEYEFPATIELFVKYGCPITLQNTDNTWWYAYFPKGDFTIKLKKKTQVIIKVYEGKKYMEVY